MAACYRGAARPPPPPPAGSLVRAPAVTAAKGPPSAAATADARPGGTAPAWSWAAPPTGSGRGRTRWSSSPCHTATGSLRSAKANPQGRLWAIQSPTSPPTPWRALPETSGQGLAHVGPGQDGHINRWRLPLPDRIRVPIPANVVGHRPVGSHGSCRMRSNSVRSSGVSPPARHPAPGHRAPRSRPGRPR